MFLSEIIEEPLQGTTLVYGPAATGKTTLCLESLQPRTVYITTNKNFNVERLRSLREDAEQIINSLFLFEPKDLAELESAVQAGLKLKPSLLVIDSLATLIRPIEKKSGNLGLHRILKLLLEFTCPILATSEVYDSFRESRHEFVGGDMLRLACRTIIELRDGVATVKKHPNFFGRTRNYVITSSGLKISQESPES